MVKTCPKWDSDISQPVPRNRQDKEEDGHLSTGLSDIDPSLDVLVSIVYVEIDKVYTGLYKHCRFC